MKHLTTEAIVLKRVNTGEADRIVTILTEKLGKIPVKATGVRKITSRRSSHIEPLNLSILSLYRGKGMAVLTEAQTVESFSALKCDLSKIGYAYYVCELVDGLCPENQENRSVFNLLKDTLTRICEETNVQLLIHDFELTLLSLLGFLPQAELAEQINTERYIEQILEKRLKVRQILPRLL